ncbi:MAG: outer membrane beta-barrel protein [Bryobacterales bacterium]|nr:outer membrane beta-barrel protein [Bryobacterales bacterium]
MKLGFIFLLSISVAAAQGIGVGVKGGVPFGDAFKATGFIGGEPFRANTQRFTVGPMFEVRLPFGLGIEFDALYKRFDQTGGSIRIGSTVAKTGSSWEFPLLGKYRFGRSFAKPYVEAGVSFNRLSDYLVPFKSLPSPPSDQPVGSTTRTGLAVGAGIELKLSIVRISPGIRFSHWGDKLFVPSTNAADFLIGVSF